MTTPLVTDGAGAGGGADAGDSADLRLGASIRQLRQRRGLTLVRLAAATDLSHPFLSQVERGLAQPSLSSLRRIAVALQTSPIELIASAEVPDGATPTFEVHRRGEITVDAAFASGSARTLASGARPLHPLEVIGENSAPGPTFEHGEDEFLYVVEGHVIIELAGVEQLLGVGDSAYYAGGVAHRWWSADGDAYRLVVVKQGAGPLRWSAE